MITANIITHSVSPYGKEIVTFVLEYPRFIHAQLLTHRAFSRNTSSSRAIPISRMIDDIEANPVEPVYWGQNQRGMVADKEVDENMVIAAKLEWTAAKKNAIESARKLSAMGVHKQTVNRLLEPFSLIRCVLTATEFDNFFSLRLSHDAQPEIQLLAQLMKGAIEKSKPKEREFHEPHIPFVMHEESKIGMSDQIKVSVARCARVSYYDFRNSKVSELQDDIDLYNRLLEERHLSPFEHQAFAHEKDKRSGNFVGWIQYRQLL